MNYSIGVAIASYNGENFISEQIESIINQTKKVDKIIISDDQSTDRTVDIIKTFIKKDYPIELHINQKNGLFIKLFRVY